VALHEPEVLVQRARIGGGGENVEVARPSGRNGSPRGPILLTAPKCSTSFEVILDLADIGG
jgi:hypothetical protein